MKYKSIVEMQGVTLKPIYRNTKFSAIHFAKVCIKDTQRLHFSYNVAATIIIFEKINKNWHEIDQVYIDPLQSQEKMIHN